MPLTVCCMRRHGEDLCWLYHQPFDVGLSTRRLQTAPASLGLRFTEVSKVLPHHSVHTLQVKRILTDDVNRLPAAFLHYADVVPVSGRVLKKVAGVEEAAGIVAAAEMALPSTVRAATPDVQSAPLCRGSVCKEPSSKGEEGVACTKGLPAYFSAAAGRTISAISACLEGSISFDPPVALGCACC